MAAPWKHSLRYLTKLSHLLFFHCLEWSINRSGSSFQWQTSYKQLDESLRSRETVSTLVPFIWCNSFAWHYKIYSIDRGKNKIKLYLIIRKRNYFFHISKWLSGPIKRWENYTNQSRWPKTKLQITFKWLLLLMNQSENRITNQPESGNFPLMRGLMLSRAKISKVVVFELAVRPFVPP